MCEAAAESQEIAQPGEATWAGDGDGSGAVATVLPGSAAGGESPGEKSERDEEREDCEDHVFIEKGFRAKKSWQSEDPPA